MRKVRLTMEITEAELDKHPSVSDTPSAQTLLEKAAVFCEVEEYSMHSLMRVRFVGMEIVRD